MSEEAQEGVVFVDDSTDTDVENKDFTISEESLVEDGFSPKEIAMAKRQGLLSSDKEEEKKENEDLQENQENKKNEEGENEKNEEPLAEKKEEALSSPSSFEEMDDVLDKTPKKFHNEYSSNEKALYFRYKTERNKRQETEKKLKELHGDSSELNAKKLNDKIEKINNLLSSPPEDLSIEDIQNIISEKNVETLEIDKPLTRRDIDRMREAQDKVLKEKQGKESFLRSRISNIEKYGIEVYDNFEEVITMAQQVIDSDNTGLYFEKLNAGINNAGTPEPQVVEMIVKIAKLNDNFGKEAKGNKNLSDNGKSNDVDRMLKNSKKINPAAVPSSNGRHSVKYEDLSPEQAIKVWDELPEKVRKKFLHKV